MGSFRYGLTTLTMPLAFDALKMDKRKHYFPINHSVMWTHISPSRLNKCNSTLHWRDIYLSPCTRDCMVWINVVSVRVSVCPDTARHYWSHTLANTYLGCNCVLLDEKDIVIGQKYFSSFCFVVLYSDNSTLFYLSSWLIAHCTGLSE